MKKKTLNLISASQFIHTAQSKKTEMILYVICDGLTDLILNLMTHNNPQIQVIIHKYKNVFCSELLNELPPEWEIEHEIDTDDVKPVNIASYFLSHIHSEKLRH